MGVTIYQGSPGPPGAPGPSSAAGITFAPAGSIAATNAQSAIEETASEAATADSTESAARAAADAAHAAATDPHAGYRLESAPLVNADIDAAAAIAKSKLASLGIVDADVDAISQSKITGLAGTYVSVAGAETITGVKTFLSQAVGNIPLMVKGFASQTGDLQQWQNSAGTVLAAISATGSFYIQSISCPGGATFGNNVTTTAGTISAPNIAAGPYIGGAMNVSPSYAGGIGAIIRGAASQTADLQQWQNSAGTVLKSISASGKSVNPNGVHIGPANEIGISGAPLAVYSTSGGAQAYFAEAGANHYYGLRIHASTGADQALVSAQNLSLVLDAAGGIEYRAYGGYFPICHEYKQSAAFNITGTQRLSRWTGAMTVTAGAGEFRLAEFQGTMDASLTSTHGYCGLFMNMTETAIVATANNRLMDLQVGGVTKAKITRTGAIISSGYHSTKQTVAPADTELVASELAYWLDDTAGATKVMFKAKNAAGTVVTGSLALV